jgi:hypothetical protein
VSDGRWQARAASSGSGVSPVAKWSLSVCLLLSVSLSLLLCLHGLAARDVRQYTANLDDAGKMLTVVYTPVRSDGVVGPAASSNLTLRLGACLLACLSLSLCVCVALDSLLR